MGRGWAVRKGKETRLRLRRGKEEGGKGIINIDCTSTIILPLSRQNKK
jgi:hypothetical protein